jgi:hypothetical protein
MNFQEEFNKDCKFWKLPPFFMDSTQSSGAIANINALINTALYSTQIIQGGHRRMKEK